MAKPKGLLSFIYNVLYDHSTYIEFKKEFKKGKTDMCDYYGLSRDDIDALDNYINNGDATDLTDQLKSVLTGATKNFRLW